MVKGAGMDYKDKRTFVGNDNHDCPIKETKGKRRRWKKSAKGREKLKSGFESEQKMIFLELFR